MRIPEASLLASSERRMDVFGGREGKHKVATIGINMEQCGMLVEEACGSCLQFEDFGQKRWRRSRSAQCLLLCWPTNLGLTQYQWDQGFDWQGLTARHAAQPALGMVTQEEVGREGDRRNQRAIKSYHCLDSAEAELKIHNTDVLPSQEAQCSEQIKA